MDNHKQAATFKELFSNLTTNKAISIIIVLGFLVYFNGLFNGFVGDDNSQLIDNAMVHSIANIPRFFAGSTFNLDTGIQVGVFYKPLMQTVFTLIYSVFGEHVFFYHLFQLLLHILNSILLFLFFKFFLKPGWSLILSLIFLVHPINSESVLYISAIQEPLFFFFGILSLLVLVKFKSDWYLVLSNVLLLASLFSKESGILFVLSSFLYLLIFDRKRIWRFLGFVIIPLVIYFYLRLNAVGLAENPMNTQIARLSLVERMINIPEIILFYIKTFIFPLNLAVAWRWAFSKITFIHFVVPIIVVSSLFFLGTYLGLGLAKRHDRELLNRYVFFCLLLIIGLALHLQIIPLDLTVSKRWFYFPMVGLLGMIGIVLMWYKIYINSRWVLIISVLILGLLSVRTMVRTFEWRDQFTLLLHDIQISKDDYSAELVIGQLFLDQMKLDQAMVHARRSIELFPFPNNYNLLGQIYIKQKNYPKAREAFVEGLKYGRMYGVLYENIAALSVVYGDRDESINFIEKALKEYPGNYKLWLYLSVLEYKNGNIHGAKMAIKEANELRPKDGSIEDNSVVDIYNSLKKI